MNNYRSYDETSNLVKNFLKYDSMNIELYIKAIINDDAESLYLLNNYFKSYIYFTFFTSYTHKTLFYTAKQIKKQIIEQNFRENLSLNVMDESFNEECINLIKASEDASNEIIAINCTNIHEILDNEKLSIAVNSLTKKQKKDTF